MQGGRTLFPWLDLLLSAILIWSAISGYISGTMRAGVRLCASLGALFLPLPFAANCAKYLRPLVEPVFWAAWDQKAVTVSSRQGHWGYLGPWQKAVALPVGPGNVSPEQIIYLVLNLTGLLFLVAVLALAIAVIQKNKTSAEPSKLGFLLGLGRGVLTISAIIILAPIGALAERGTFVSAAMGESVIVQLLMPLLQPFVLLIAPFVL